jgi:hypothetical protein
MTQTEQARDRAAELWLKMCEWDNVSPDSPFVVFSETNPYQAEYDAAMAFVKGHQANRISLIVG